MTMHAATRQVEGGERHDENETDDSKDLHPPRGNR
jgi:hypothetical protein